MHYTLPIPDFEDAREIDQIAHRALQKAGCVGVLPTPLDDVLGALDIKRASGLTEFFNAKMLQMSQEQRNFYNAGWKKIRGLAAPKARQIYTPPLGLVGRNRFRDAHEIMHIECPWHCVRENDIYVEDDKTLDSKTRDRFEIEANYGGGQLIFPATSWENDANSSDCDFASVNTLAERYGVSIRAAFRHFVEAQQISCVGLSYLPNDFASREEDGHRRLHKPVMFRSSDFAAFHADWKPPSRALDCWRQAMIKDDFISGEDSDGHACEPTMFYWHGFWNTYELMVLMCPAN